MRAFLLSLMVLAPSALFAQEGVKPGPEHAWLKKMEGTWASSMNMGGMESKGSIVYKMELGGLWLTSKMEGDLFGQKFTGQGMDGYDPAKKKYVGIWVDSMGAAPVVMEGDYDKEKKMLKMLGTGPGPDGKSIQYRSVTEYPDDDTMNFKMFMVDSKEPAFTIAYKRKK
jgi:hypothetical protein